MATGSEAVAKAKSQNGVHEKGYSNEVLYNNWFYGRVVSGPAYPWCAAFTSWVYAQIGMKANIDYPHSAGVAVCFNWYRSKGRIINKNNLKPGDQVRYTISHTGIFAYYKDGLAYCWEGNTSAGSSGSQRDGGGVHLRSRSLSFIQYGGRPNYSDTPSTSTPPAPPKPKGVLGMTKHIKISSTKKQTISKGKAVVLKTNGNTGAALAVGPAEFMATINITFDNLYPQYSAWVRVIRAGYKKGEKLKTGRTLAYEEVTGTSGTTAASVTAAGKTGKTSNGGRSSRFYVVVTTNNPVPLKVSKVRVEGLRD